MCSLYPTVELGLGSLEDSERRVSFSAGALPRATPAASAPAEQLRCMSILKPECGQGAAASSSDSAFFSTKCEENLKLDLHGQTDLVEF